MGKPENELIEAKIKEILEEFPELQEDLEIIRLKLEKMPVPVHRLLGLALMASYRQWINRLLQGK